MPIEGLLEVYDSVVGGNVRITIFSNFRIINNFFILNENENSNVWQQFRKRCNRYAPYGSGLKTSAFRSRTQRELYYGASEIGSSLVDPYSAIASVSSVTNDVVCVGNLT